MKIIYTTDLHGNIAKYNELLEIALKEEIKTIVVGGDLLPIASKRVITQQRFIDEFLQLYFAKLKYYEIDFLFITGNDDLTLHDDKLNKFVNQYSNIKLIDNKRIVLNDFEFIGMNKVADHPFDFKDRVVIDSGIYSDEGIVLIEGKYMRTKSWQNYAIRELTSMKQELEMLPKPYNKNRAIYVMHMPPFGLGYTYEDGDVGSHEIDDFLTSINPLASFHGHIKESYDISNKWMKTRNNTKIIQPGQTDFSNGGLVYVVSDLEKNTHVRKLGKING